MARTRDRSITDMEAKTRTLLIRFWCMAAARGAWLVQPAASARIEAAFFVVGDPRLQKLLSDALAGGAA